MHHARSRATQIPNRRQSGASRNRKDNAAAGGPWGQKVINTPNQLEPTVCTRGDASSRSRPPCGGAGTGKSKSAPYLLMQMLWTLSTSELQAIRCDFERRCLAIKAWTRARRRRWRRSRRLVRPPVSHAEAVQVGNSGGRGADGMKRSRMPKIRTPPAATHRLHHPHKAAANARAAAVPVPRRAAARPGG